MSKILRPAVRADEYRGVSQCHLHAAPRRRPRGVGRRHDGDGGGGGGSRCATAHERRRAAFEDSHGFNVGIFVHGRSLAADEARARASRLADGSRGIRSQEARTRVHF